MLLRQLFKQAGNVVQISSFEGGVCFHRLGLRGLRMVVGIGLRFQSLTANS